MDLPASFGALSVFQIGISGTKWTLPVFSMGCLGNPNDHNTHHRYRLTAIPLTRYPMRRPLVRGVPFEGVVSSESEPKHRIASGLCRDKVEYQ